MIIPKLKLRRFLKRRYGEKASPLIETIRREAERLGFRIYLVGGVPRDLLLGKDQLIKKSGRADLDLVVEGNACELGKALKERLRLPGKGPDAILLNRSFFTAGFRFAGLGVDIASMRRESYPYPGSLPIVELDGIYSDALRRDFTINTLYISLPNRGSPRLIDPLGGWKDLQKGVLRITYPDSFRDDPTRMIRLFRYVGRLGFRVERKTLNGLVGVLEAGHIRNVSLQRTMGELMICCMGEENSRIVRLLLEKGILSFIPWRRGGVESFAKRFRLLKPHFLEAEQIPVETLVLALILEETISSKRIALILGANLKREIATGAQYYIRDRAAIERFLRSPRKRKSDDYVRTRAVNDQSLLIYRSLHPYQRVIKRLAEVARLRKAAQLHITGDDLKKMGVRQGPQIARLLQRIVASKLDDIIRNKVEEFELARELVKRLKQ